MKAYEYHEYADIFPLDKGERLDELAHDIQEHGLHEPILLCDGKILDGRRRYLACQQEQADVEPRFQRFKGDDALALVVSRNLHRRHLTNKQRALVAARIASLRSGRPETIPPIGGDTTVKDAADAMNVSERSVERARRVLTQGTPELQQAVEGELSLTTGERHRGPGARPADDRHRGRDNGQRSPGKAEGNARRPDQPGPGNAGTTRLRSAARAEVRPGIEVAA